MKNNITPLRGLHVPFEQIDQIFTKLKTMRQIKKKRQNIKYQNSEVTLPDVAEYANSVCSNSKVKETTKKRQQDVIEYFEDSVK